MKRQIIIVVCLVAMCSCGKKNNNNTTPSAGTNGIPTGPNIVTVQSNGKTYTVSGDEASSSNVYEVEVNTYQTQGKDAHIVIRVYNGDHQGNKPDFEMHLESEKGNSSGVGTYPLKHYNEYTENFLGGVGCYGTFTGNIIVTKNDIGKLAEGTFNVVLGHCWDSTSKTITGTFKATSF